MPRYPRPPLMDLDGLDLLLHEQDRLTKLAIQSIPAGDDAALEAQIARLRLEILRGIAFALAEKRRRLSSEFLTANLHGAGTKPSIH